MKILFFVTALLIKTNAFSQLHNPAFGQYTLTQPELLASKKTVIPGLLSDPMRNYRVLSPILSTSSSYDWRMQNNFFWTGNVTTMSYNKGKFGTDFLWDIQGNLRATRGFIDISGKNKRGLKLTFLWRSLVKTKW